ncbi:hypothetical protein IPA_03685 [Ignicoccus pacificus DSM 13166]|uniref:Uncharacterized protein n=1 Tax=Ignicoccus pacificus DSM 13166 TaxID=940294 RepID=A0A977KAZ7_9CREN|nr:hypothetical protein IPA_03685 [Ignicoccus pacificus DSM 13166]
MTSLSDVIKKYQLQPRKEGKEEELEVGNSPFYIKITKDDVYKVRIELDKERLEELIEELIDEGNTKDDIIDTLDEMLDEAIRIAYEIINSLEKQGIEIKSELTSSVMDIKDYLIEELEYLEEIS